MTTKKNIQKDNRRKKAFRINSLLPTEARRYARKMGFAQTEILSKWPTIVGENMANFTVPEQLRFPRGKRTGATLHISCDAGWALELQHLEPLLLERINQFFGYGAVAKIAVRQAPLSHVKRQQKAPEPPALSAEEEADLQNMIAATKDDDIRATLERLGRDILRHEKKS